MTMLNTYRRMMAVAGPTNRNYKLPYYFLLLPPSFKG